MERLKELLVPKNIIYFIFVIFFLMWLDVSKIENSLLHFLKPTSIEIGKYSINLHKQHWAYLKEDSKSYYLLGKDGMLTLQILKDAQDKIVQDEFLQCYHNEIEHKKYKYVEGDITVCESPLKLVFYFQSDDGGLFMRSELNEPMNEHFMSEYLHLLQGIKKH